MSSPTPAPFSAERLAVAAALALACVLAVAHLRFLHFVCDDAYITFRYAANLAHGWGPVYNAGERVEGYTNFLWMVTSSWVIALGGAPDRVMPACSAGCAIATVVATVLAFLPRSGGLGGAHEGDDGGNARRAAWSAAFAPLLLAGSASFAAWATSGLETAMFTLLVTLGVVAAARGAAVWAAFALALASLTRPEGWLVSACALGWLALRGRRIGVGRAPLGIAVLVWAACVVPHLVWRLAYYGELVPNTFAIKAPGLASITAGAAYLGDAFWRQHLYVLLVPALGLLAAGTVAAPRRASAAERARLELLAAIVIPYLAYVVTTGGDFMPLHRFVAPMLPLLAIAAGAAFGTLIDRLDLRPIVSAAFGFVLLATFGGLNLAESRLEQRPWTRGPVESVGLTRANAADWRRVGLRLREVSTPGDSLAITAAGIIPYLSELYTIDLLGLTAPDLSAYRRREVLRAGHTHYLSGAALERLRPQFLLGHPEVRPTTQHLGLTLDLEPEWRDRVLAHYALLGLTLPGDSARYVAIAVRHDAAARVEAAGLREAAGPPPGP